MTEPDAPANLRQDVIHRAEKLPEVRRFSKSSARMFWLCILVALALSLHGGATEGEWRRGLPWLLIAMIPAFGYFVFRFRIAALTTLENEKRA